MRLLCLGVLLFAGCATKKPAQNYRLTGCTVVRSWTGEDGKEHKECECRDQQVIGIDARTHELIIRCH